MLLETGGPEVLGMGDLGFSLKKTIKKLGKGLKKVVKAVKKPLAAAIPIIGGVALMATGAGAPIGLSLIGAGVGIAASKGTGFGKPLELLQRTVIGGAAGFAAGGLISGGASILGMAGKILPNLVGGAGGAAQPQTESSQGDAGGFIPNMDPALLAQMQQAQGQGIPISMQEAMVPLDAYGLPAPSPASAPALSTGTILAAGAVGLLVLAAATKARR